MSTEKIYVSPSWLEGRFFVLSSASDVDALVKISEFKVANKTHFSWYLENFGHASIECFDTGRSLEVQTETYATSADGWNAPTRDFSHT